MSICVEGLNFLEDARSIKQFLDHPSVLEFPILCGLEEAVSMSLDPSYSVYCQTILRCNVCHNSINSIKPQLQNLFLTLKEIDHSKKNDTLLLCLDQED